jgi:uncharacterized protein (UPF0335 family)
VDNLIRELAEKLTSLENEIKILHLDRKDLLSEYKEKIDLKAFRAAWMILKKRENVNEVELDNILDIINNIE